jgi:hypothetical protein
MAELEQFEVPHDILQLPSKGLYYPSKKSSVKVSYLNASDENILTSINLMESGEMLNTLLDRKVLDKDLRPDHMLDGDRVAILFWLRATGYGTEFPMKLTDPTTRKVFEYVVDLSKIPNKEDLLQPDENGEMEYLLPYSKKKCKFKYLTGAENNALIKADDERVNKMGRNAFSTLMTSRLAAQIQEIDGIRDKGKIAQFVEYMHVKDSAEIRKYIIAHEPGLDLRVEVVAPSGAPFLAAIGITPEFFWPYI